MGRFPYSMPGQHSLAPTDCLAAVAGQERVEKEAASLHDSISWHEAGAISSSWVGKGRRYK